MLLEEATKRAKESGQDLYSVYLHTPVKNQMAIDFYTKNGFEKKEIVPEYYKSLSVEEG